MNKAYLDDHPGTDEEYHDKPVHMASEEPGLPPICGHEHHLWTTTDAKYVDCPDCLKRLGG